MRLASYNLENLFDRAKALNQDTWAQGKPTLETFKRLSILLNKPVYSAADKKKILADLKTLGILKKDDAGPFVLLRQNRGRLLKRPANGPVEVVAQGRNDWVGWIELKVGPVNELASRMTAQVVADVDADVLGLVEVENRIAVTRFNDLLLPSVGGDPYTHAMVIDGNDERGIDVGILAKRGFEIDLLRSHVDDTDDHGQIFSRDCAEYEVVTPNGSRLLVLVNHLKSKGYGSPADSNAKRKRQAKRVRAIYDDRRDAGIESIAIVGDFNDTPASDPLSPLFGGGSGLKDVSEHPGFIGDGRPGTYANGTASNKIDYILLSPALFAKTTGGGVFRKGVWGGTHGTLWPIYPLMTKAIEAASDHAAIFADLAI